MNQDVNLLKYLATVDSSIGKLYDKLIKELAKIGASIADLDTGKLFSFSDYPKVKEKVEKILDKYTDSLESKITNGMKDAIDMSYLANKTFLKDYSKISDKTLRTQRETAKNAFIRSRAKSEYGLGLSDRVWNYTQQAKAEFEAGMSEVIEDGIYTGISAEELGRRVRDKLKYPDMVYRRYHLKKLTKEGKKDVIEWRKKVVDDNGNVHFIKTEMDLVGRGVYRSSRKNALRLAATEINMAYRYADNVRWQSEPFIRGIRIRLSNNHTLNGKPFYDICDELQGDYPKSFMWSGWHPRCRCSASPILVPQEEMDEISNLPEEEYQNYRPKDLITTMPNKFKDWFYKNKERVTESISRGTQPYFIRDNKAIIDNLFNPKKRTPEQEQKLIDFWNEKKKRTAFLRSRAENVMRVYKERFGFDIPGFPLFEISIEHGDLNDIDLQTKNFAKNLSKVQRNIRKSALNQIELAKKVPEVDYNELEALLNGNNIGLIKAGRMELEERMFDMINAENELSDLIDDVRVWHKKFTIEELRLAHKAIEKQFAKVDSLATFDEKIKSIEKEINYVENPNYLKPHTIYPTWKVVQDAYYKKYYAILDEKYWHEISNSYSDCLGFKTTSKVYSSLLSKLNAAIANKDKTSADILLNKLSVQKSGIESQRKKSKMISIESKSLSKKEIKMLIEEFENADLYNLDDEFRQITEDFWATLTDEERRVLTKYTQTYKYLNEPLRGMNYYGDRAKEEFDHDLPILTDILNRISMPRNIVIRRGVGEYRIPELSKYLGNVKPGDEFIDGAFLSTGLHREKGFHDTYDLRIVVPKGSKGIFAEPFSHYTDNCKFDYEDSIWDGKSKEYIGTEFEWIGQRGSKFRVLKVQGNTIYLEMIGQLYEVSRWGTFY